MAGSNKREWNNCFIKNNQEILLDLAVFAFQEQPKDNLMAAISRACYNGSYTMAAMPIKSLEVHYIMPVPVFSNPSHLNYISIVPRHSIRILC